MVCYKALLGILYALWLEVIMTLCKSELLIWAVVPSSWSCSHANVELFSLTQEATQAENALIVENGTHAEEANADDSTVMLFFSSPRHVFFFFSPLKKHPFTVSNHFLFTQYNWLLLFDSFQSPHLLIHFCLAWVWHLASQCVER